METLASSVALPAVPCPGCGQLLSSAAPSAAPKSARKFDDCLRKCVKCGIGLSNARTPHGETAIYRNLLENVPKQLRDGFREALTAGVNELNRENKVSKAAFSTSEDALTWSYFEGLRRAGRLSKLQILPSSKEPLLILWGSQVGGATGRRSEVPAALTEISEALREDPSRRTEPDVVLDFGDDGIAIIEVKHRAGNETTPSRPENWALYLKDQHDGPTAHSRTSKR
ncbi:MAG TPA: hypothetical protein VFE23_11745 [Usitatibacter sp.]|nr:hypothetical protein [Usitatibacter sp.]